MEEMEAIDELRVAVREVDWAAYRMWPTLEWYQPARVPEMFDQLLAADHAAAAQVAYNAVLDAVGHNHSGWLYATPSPASV